MTVCAARFGWPPDVVMRQRIGDLTSLFLGLEEVSKARG